MPGVLSERDTFFMLQVWKDRDFLSIWQGRLSVISFCKKTNRRNLTVKLPKKLTGFWFLYIKMTVHIKQLTGNMRVRGWTSGRSLTACTKLYCNNVMLQLRLEIYFSHKTNQTYRKCHMHITFDCQQILCSSLYLLPLQIWINMIQMFKFMIQPNV